MKSLLIVSGVFIAFGAVSLIVWFTRGKKRRWVERKLRLGGFLVSLTTLASGTVSCTVTCHAAPENPDVLLYALLLTPESKVDQITFTGTSAGALTVSLGAGGTFNGTVTNRKSNLFSYAITDGFGTVVQSGDLAALDGSFNSATESFAVTLGGAIVAGDYTLNIYNVAVVNVVVGTTVAIQTLTLHVVP